MSSDTFSDLHLESSASRRDCRSADDDVVVDVVLVDDAVELEDADVPVELLGAPLLDDDDGVAMGVFPSFLACTNASTNALFSRNVFVDIPYDSNSCLIVETLIDLISASNSSVLVSSAVLNN